MVSSPIFTSQNLKYAPTQPKTPVNHLAADYMRALKWPIIAWVIVDIIFLAITFVHGVMNMLTPAGLSPLFIAFGAWAGYKIVEFKGKFPDVIAAGVIVGVVCGVLGVILLLAHGMTGMGDLTAEFTFDAAMNLVGAIVGGGYALTK